MYLPVLPRAATEHNGHHNGHHSGDNSNSGLSVAVICTISILCLMAAIFMSYVVLRTLRRMNSRPKYLPGKFLKQKWTQWRPGVIYGQVPDQPTQSRTQGIAYTGPAGGPEGGTQMNTAAPGPGPNGINRDTSVRSTITLPAYSSNPKPTEQIIAREGDRAGMDVVVEFPDTAEEEEARREEMMESLYHIRQQRRQEVAERQARRQDRREAPATGDVLRLEQLRAETQSRRRDRSLSATDANSSVNRSSLNLLREHEAHSWAGRISRVNYAALGCVRHDGSRVRGSSDGSDSRPLLDASALPSGHTRGDSASSLISASSMSDGETLSPGPSRPQSISGPEGNVGTHSIPPPDYEHLEWGEAPAYESRSAEDEDHSPERLDSLQLPEVTPLPSIQINVLSPASPSQRSAPEEHESSSASPSGSTGPDHPPTSH